MPELAAIAPLPPVRVAPPDPVRLHQLLLELALQRTLHGFEQSTEKIMAQFDCAAWACVLPPSFQAGGRQLFIARGIRSGGPMLSQASRLGFASLFEPAEGRNQVLAQLGREIAPAPGATCQILQVNRDRGGSLILFCYRAPGRPGLSPAEASVLHQVGVIIDRCFQALAEQQEQEFLAGLFRLVGNLHPEGMCIMDTRYRMLFESRKFREHLHLWTHGPDALQNLTLPRQTTLPPVWTQACEKSFQAFRRLPLPPTSSRMVVTQGPLLSLRHPLTDEQWIEGAVRYIACQSSLGVRPYLLLTSTIKEVQSARGGTLQQVAKALQFSRRETQLAALILKGDSTQEIADRLRISVPTVKTHVRNILRKAGVKTRLQFAGLCRQAHG